MKKLIIVTTLIFLNIGCFVNPNNDNSLKNNNYSYTDLKEIEEEYLFEEIEREVNKQENSNLGINDYREEEININDER